MKLWLVQEREDLPSDKNPFGYECFSGFVIRATNEDDARRQASKNSGKEGGAVWLSSQYTTCTEISVEGEPDIILFNFNAA